MWTIRFLNGPRAGESIELKQRQIIGRDESSDIVIQDSGVSKKHAEIIVESGQITLKDLGSSNGTYVNGIRIRSHDLNIGDKIAFYQVIAEFGLAQESLRVPVARSSPRSNNMQIDKVQNRTLVNSSRNVLPSDFQSESISESSHGLQSSNALSQKKIDSPDRIVETAAEFINEKVMPNVFSMTEQLSFKTVFLGIMIIFLLTVTILSVIPLYLVTSESVQSESFLRALSVARSVAQVNEARIRSGDLQKFSTDLLFQEKGIEDIYIIGRDGVVIAPLEQSGSAPKHVGFARQVRGQPREFVTSSLDRVLAAVPIIAFDSDQQVNIAKAHVIVSYHPKTLAFDDAKIFSLFIQVLVIGVIVGGFLFYILYKLIEHVFRQIYQKLDEAIRSGADQISINFNFPILSDLLTIINSLLVRAQSANQSVNPQFVTRMNEYISICNMIPYPSLIVRYDRIIQHINGAFAHLINMTEVQLQNHSINEIPDSALQQNLNYLIDQATLNPHQVYSDTLDMGGHIFSINCQAVRIESDQIDHFVISISPHEGTSS